MLLLLVVVTAATLAAPAEGKQSILLDGVETISHLTGLDTVSYLAKTVTSFMYIAQVIQEETDGPRLPFLGDANERELLERMKMVWEDLSRLESIVKEIPQQTAEAVRHNLRRDVRLELQLSEVARIVSRVDSADSRLQNYIRRGWDADKGKWTIERHTLEDMALSTVSHGAGSVRTSLDHLHSLVAKGSLLFDLVRSLKVGRTYYTQVHCDKTENPRSKWIARETRATFANYCCIIRKKLRNE